MHSRGRYADAAELIRQELALYPPNPEVHSPLLLPLKIQFIHHQMFYRPVTELWPQRVDLLTAVIERRTLNHMAKFCSC